MTFYLIFFLSIFWDYDEARLTGRVQSFLPSSFILKVIIPALWVKLSHLIYMTQIGQVPVSWEARSINVKLLILTLPLPIKQLS